MSETRKTRRWWRGGDAHQGAAHLAALLGCVACGIAPAASAQEPDAVRGMYLYENHCTECHTSVVHIQENPKAQSLDEIEAFVRRWVAYKNLTWSNDEIRDVLMHLNSRYYKY